LVAARGDVAVNTVGGDIEGAVFKPFDIDVARLKRDVFHFGKRLDPINALAMFAPEPVGVTHRGGIHFIVFGSVDVGVGGHGGGRGIGFGHSGFPFVFCLAS